MADSNVNREAPNTLLSTSTIRILDLLCEGQIQGFVPKPGAYGNDPLCSTYYDDVPVRNADGSYNFNVSGGGFSFDYTLGTPTQSGIPGFQKVESMIPLSSNTRIANPPQGAGPQKTVVASFNSNTYPDADSVKVTVRVPSLLAQDDKGNTNPYTIDYAVDLSVNNGEFVTVGLESISGKCTAGYQRTTVYQLPKSTPPSSYYEWKVRVRRVSYNILSIRTQNEIFVDSISIISSSLYAYPNSVLVGTALAGDQFSSIPTRAYDLLGLRVKVPTYYTPTQYSYDTAAFTRYCDMEEGNKLIGFHTQSASEADGITAGMRVAGAGIPADTVVTSVAPGDGGFFFSISKDPLMTASNVSLEFYPTAAVKAINGAMYPPVWDGSFWPTKVWTDNPAWIFYDLATDPIHGLGDYVLPGSVDKWSLYRISQFCDKMVSDGAGGSEPQFTCNVQIQDPEDAYSVLLSLASVFRGMLYYANGTIRATQQQNDSPVHIFTNANVVDGAFTYSDTARSARATVAKVKWTDPNNDFRENIEYIEDIDGISRYGIQEKEVTAFACTSKGQAHRLGTWILQSERLLTETITFQTSLEGNAVAPGDNFAVYDNFRNNKSQAGRITSFSPGRSVVYLDREVAIEPGYFYSLSCVVPKAQLDGTGSISNSDQIALIRQPQIETFAVTTAPIAATSAIVVSGSFSSSLFAGSPFILSASGQDTNVYAKATFYTCLATSEVDGGKVEVLGLQANTGINFAVQDGYTVVDWPQNSGDRTSTILPPSNLRVTGVTGVTDDNAFYSSINLSWTNSPSPDLSHYVVSGKEWDTEYERTTVIGTEFNFIRNDTGQYLFSVAAVNHGGRESSYLTGGLLVSKLNALGTIRPLSGVRLVQNYDPLYVNSVTGYTGYVGINPGFRWTIPEDSDGNQIVDAQFISGYRVTAKSLDGLTQYYTSTLSGAENTFFQFTGAQIRGFPGSPRGFQFLVDIYDVDGQLYGGGALKVNNPPMKPPYSSGFLGYSHGLMYNVTPSLQYDTSGIYLWTNASPSFTPNYTNQSFISSNLAGHATVAPTGTFYTWFALTDTFSASGNPIYGPISGNSAQVFDASDLDITAEINNALASISGAFNLLTGQVTNSLTVISGDNQLTLQMVQGLSGQTTGLPGVVNTALNVRVNTAVTNSSGALSQQIDAVRSNTELSGRLLTAQVGGVSTALTNTGSALGSRIDLVNAGVLSASGRIDSTGATLLSALATSGGALAQWITNLGAQTSGYTSSVQIGARAFVTGDTNGTGGAAVAAWGFKLNANGKVVSMQATSEDWGAGNPAMEYGTIAFGNANLQSNTYSAGSAGWQIKADGSAEFNNASVRGAFTGGTAPTQSIIDSNGLRVGNVAGSYIWLKPGSGNITVYDSNGDANVTVTNYNDGDPGGEFGAMNLYRGGGDVLAAITAQFGGYIQLGAISAGHLELEGATKTIYFHNDSNSTYITESNGLQLYGSSASNRHVQVKNCDLDCDADVSAATFTTTSSRRWKENIVPFQGALATIQSLTGVRFDWRTRDLQNDFGLIAEDVAAVLPTAVHYEPDGEVKGVDYGRLTAVLIEAVKDLSEQVNDLKRQLAAR